MIYEIIDLESLHDSEFVESDNELKIATDYLHFYKSLYPDAATYASWSAKTNDAGAVILANEVVPVCVIKRTGVQEAVVLDVDSEYGGLLRCYKGANAWSAAERRLHKYVQDSWNEHTLGVIPEGAEAAIEMYFEHDTAETYSIVPVQITPTV